MLGNPLLARRCTTPEEKKFSWPRHWLHQGTLKQHWKENHDFVALPSAEWLTQLGLWRLTAAFSLSWASCIWRWDKYDVSLTYQRSFGKMHQNQVRIQARRSNEIVMEAKPSKTKESFVYNKKQGQMAQDWIKKAEASTDVGTLCFITHLNKAKPLWKWSLTCHSDTCYRHLVPQA